ICLLPRSALPPAGWAHSVVLLSSISAKHKHRKAHRKDDGGRAEEGAQADGVRRSKNIGEFTVVFDRIQPHRSGASRFQWTGERLARKIVLHVGECHREEQCDSETRFRLVASSSHPRGGRGYIDQRLARGAS